MSAKPAVLPEGTPREQAQWLYDNRFVQVSRKYRMLARLPEGCDDPCKLLADTELKLTLQYDLRPEIEKHWRKHYPKWAYGMGPMHAAKHWMSCHSEDFEGCHIELPKEQQEVFDLYRRLGGDSWPWWL